MAKWIEIKDKTYYNLTEIMEIHKCSEERAVEIALGYYDEREHDIDIFEEGIEIFD